MVVDLQNFNLTATWHFKLIYLNISSSERNSSAGERRTDWATSWRWKIKGESGGQWTIWFSLKGNHALHSFMALFGFFLCRWSSTYVWYVGVEVMKIDYCFVMGVTTAITPSVWSHPSTTSPKATGGAPSAWLRWAAPDCLHLQTDDIMTFFCLCHVIV